MGTFIMTRESHGRSREPAVQSTFMITRYRNFLDLAGVNTERHTDEGSPSPRPRPARRHLSTCRLPGSYQLPSLTLSPLPHYARAPPEALTAREGRRPPRGRAPQPPPAPWTAAPRRRAAAPRRPSTSAFLMFVGNGNDKRSVTGWSLGEISRREHGHAAAKQRMERFETTINQDPAVCDDLMDFLNSI